jgi:hypothetical protein
MPSQLNIDSVNIHNIDMLRGMTARPPVYFNYDNPRLWVILIMGQENYRNGKFSQGNI